MQIRSELHLIVFLALYNFSSASGGTALSNAHPHNANNHCHWSSTARGRTHYSFLRESAGTLRLYLSTWTESQRLVDCVVVEESEITEHYLALCQERRAGNILGSPQEHFNTSVLLAPGNPCVIGSTTGFEPSVQVASNLEDADTGRASGRDPTVSSGPELRRRKRSLVFPGTLWCGTGTKANAYEDIGMFEKTDRCCREHDHCSHTIPAFRVNYGVFNHNFFTVSHCECDRRFRQCLQEVNDTISNMVGYSFYNMLKVPCFVFSQKKHCTQLTWFGLCKSVAVAPYAIFQYPTPYSSTQMLQENEGSEVTAVPASSAGKQDVASSSTSRPRTTTYGNSTAPKRRGKPCKSPGRDAKTSKPRGRCRPRGPARGDSFQPSRKTTSGGKGRKASVEPPTAAPAVRTTTTPTTTATKTTSTTTSTATKTTSTTTSTATKTTSTTTKTTSTTTRRKSFVRKTTSLHAGNRKGSKKQSGSENALPSDLPWAPPKHGSDNLPAPVKDTRHKGKLQLCDCYKQLDECRHKILPHDQKYGIHNTEPKILYHCNCTRGLSHQLRSLNDSSELLQALLLDFVSLSCFKGLHLDDCLRGRRCHAVLSESKHLKKTLKRLGVPEVISDPPGHPPKKKRRNSRKVKRRRGKRIPVRLYSRCLRITSKNRT